MKLKTLKDIILEPQYESDYVLNIKDELLDAAREWIKDLEESLEPIKHYVSSDERTEKEAQIDWIKHFFNL